MLVQALEDIWAITPDPRRDRLTVAFVTHLVAMATDVSPGDISAHKRTSVTFHWPLARVAFAFGRDRTTCAHACHRIEDLREDAGFDAKLVSLEACLRQAPRQILEGAR